MKCIIGIDGGGTKSLLRAVNPEGVIICETIGGSTNICSNTEAQVFENIQSLWSKTIQQADSPLEPEAICLGTAGITAVNAVSFLTGALEKITGCKHVTVVGDMEIPLAANAPDENAVALIAGTGSVCYAKSAEGVTARSGGWGHLIGDEGSGYWISTQALRAITREVDGQGEKTSLTPLFLERMGCKTVWDMLSCIYSGVFDKTRIASYAPLVGIAAENYDAVAVKILYEAAKGLFSICRAAMKGAGIEETGVKIFLSGGVVLHNRIIIDSLIGQIHKAYPRAAILTLEKDAAWGAVQIAKASVHSMGKRGI